MRVKNIFFWQLCFDILCFINLKTSLKTERVGWAGFQIMERPLKAVSGMTSYKTAKIGCFSLKSMLANSWHCEEVQNCSERFHRWALKCGEQFRLHLWRKKIQEIQIRVSAPEETSKRNRITQKCKKRRLVTVTNSQFFAWYLPFNSYIIGQLTDPVRMIHPRPARNLLL